MRYLKWAYVTQTNNTVTVLPDGCRDILLIEHPSAETSLQLTTWDDRARSADLVQGQRLTGFRLPPGFTVNELDLEHLPPNSKSIVDFIQSYTEHQSEISQAIETLGYSGTTIKMAAAQARCISTNSATSLQ